MSLVGANVDHFVIVTRELDRTVDAVQAVVGLRPVEGGSHVGRGTRNYRLGLGQTCFLEIIAVDDDQPEPHRPRLFGLDHGFGPSRLVTWGIAPSDFDDAFRSATLAGAAMGAVEWLRRPSADGEVRVRLTERPDVLEDGVIPFLVDWGTTPHPARDLPQARFVGLRLTHPHPASTRRILDTMGVHPEVAWGASPSLELLIEGAHGLVYIR